MDTIYKDTITRYERLLLNNLTQIYSARKSVSRIDWTRFSNFLIDKFAIHSFTLFHMLYGFIEHKDSTPHQRKVAFDLFSINSLIRVLIETYTSFNHIFISPKSHEEKHFRFLLWQLDGLLSKRKFDIETSDFKKAEEILSKDKQTITTLHSVIENNPYFNLIPKIELIKIYNPSKEKVSWKFTLSEELNIKPLKIVELIKLIFPGRVFTNFYKYSSMHTHSGYLSVEHFENFRGKAVSDEHVDTLTELGIYLTAFLIRDLCLIDEKVYLVFLQFPLYEQNYINQMNKNFRHI